MAYLIFAEEIWDRGGSNFVSFRYRPSVTKHLWKYCVIMKISEDKFLSKLYTEV